MSDSEQIDISIAQAKSTIETYKVLERLMNYPEYKEIIEQGYFINQAVDAVAMKAAPGMDHDAAQKGLNNKIIGIGELRQYFITIRTLASEAEKAINRGREEQAFIDEEEASGVFYDA